MRYREEYRQLIRRGVVDAAMRILATDGEAALTMTRVADELGLSIGSLYRYFPSRAAVVTAVWEQRLAAIAPRIPNDESTAPADHLRSLADAWATAGRSDPAALERLADALIRVDPTEQPEPSELIAIADPLVEAISQCFGRSAADREVAMWRCGVLLRIVATVSDPPPSEHSDTDLAHRLVHVIIDEWWPV